MARPTSALSIWGPYLAARLAVAGLTTLSVDANQTAAILAGKLLFQLDRRHRRRAIENIRLALPDLDDREVHRMASASLEHIAQVAVEAFYTHRRINRDAWTRHIEFDNVGPTLALLNAGKPLILLTGHVGNWEIPGCLLASLGYPINAVARPLDNPLINDWLLGQRERSGLRIITKWDATDRMVGVLRRGEALAFIADQNAGHRGLFVPFFGCLASTYKSIGLLAMTENVPIVCGYAHRIGPGFRYRAGIADLILPQDWADRHDPLYYITARFIRAIETAIRRQPDQYLWMHRRWKVRPRFELENKPMPAGLRKNLQDLPWMDQPTLDRIQNTRPRL